MESPLRARSASGTLKSQSIELPQPARVRSKTIAPTRGLRRSSSAAAFKLPSLEKENSAAELQYVFGVAGQSDAMVQMLAQLFPEETLVSGKLVRAFSLPSRPADLVPVSFSLFFSYGHSLLFDDAALRRCDALVYVFDVVKASDVAEFRKLRKRLSSIRSDTKVMLVASSLSTAHQDVLESDADIENRVNECRILAGNHGCVFGELGPDSEVEDVERLMEKLFGEVVGAKNESAPDVAQGSRGLPPSLSPRRVGRTVELCVVGDIFVGKTTLIQKLAYGIALEQYVHTEKSQAHRTLMSFANQNLKLNILDTISLAASPNVADVVPLEVRERMHGWLVVFSVRSMSSFRLVTPVVQQLRALSTRMSPILVIGTNTDELLFRVVSRNDAEMLCGSLGVEYAEVDCRADATTCNIVLAPLLKLVLSTGQMDTSKGAIGSAQSSAEAVPILQGRLVLVKDVIGGLQKRFSKVVEIQGSKLLYKDEVRQDDKKSASSAASGGTGGSPTSTAAASPEKPGKEEKRFSGLFASVRRRSSSVSLRRTPGESGTSPARASGDVAARDSEASGGSSSAIGGDGQEKEAKSILLVDCIVTPVKGNSQGETSFGFRVVDARGKQVILEAESLALRDQWIHSIRRASVSTNGVTGSTVDDSRGGLISSDTLGRRRGKTFTGLRSSASTTSIPGATRGAAGDW